MKLNQDKWIRTEGLVFVAALLVASCDRNPVAGSASAPSPAGRSTSSLAVAHSTRTLDDEYAALADEVPGFGGLFYDGSRRLTVYMKDPSTFEQSKARLSAFLIRQNGGSPAASTKTAVDIAGARVLAGTYDFRELLTLYRNRILPRIVDMPGLSTTDIDETINRIVIGVTNRSLIGPAVARIASLDLPAGVVIVNEQTPARSDSYLKDSLRPVPGGAYITVNDVKDCTLGYNLVNLIGDTIATARYLVTASHCSSTRSSVDYSQAKQFGAFFATETGDPPYFFHSANPDCPTGYSCRNSDASLFQYYDTTIAPNHGKVALPANGDSSFTSFATITSVQSPSVGYAVNMIGSWTGRTSGTVAHTCTNIYSITGYPNVAMLCQARGTYVSTGGDSGAPVITLFGDNTAWATGVHWGSTVIGGVTYGVFSPMYAVLDEFFYGVSGYPNLSPVVYP
jgi:hypothetical protein